jgi:hypothetical protein
MIACIAGALAALTTVATASDHGRRHEREERGDDRDLRSRDARSPEDAAARALYRKECGACHLDFPPGLLSAASHRRILAGLERHFGQDADLEPAVRDRLETWLVANAADAGSGRRRSRETRASASPGDAPLRFTEGAWFRREHRKVGPDVLARPSVRTFVNCGACHSGASAWDFDDDRVTIPAS